MLDCICSLLTRNGIVLIDVNFLFLAFFIIKRVVMVNRSNEAQLMYMMLQSHPNAQVSKKTRQIHVHLSCNHQFCVDNIVSMFMVESYRLLKGLDLTGQLQ